MEYADSPFSYTGLLASSIEVCNCPSGYLGTSCEVKLILVIYLNFF